MDLGKPKVRDDFWEAFRACAEGNRVRPDRSPSYVIPLSSDHLEKSFPLSPPTQDRMQTTRAIQPR
jgi:hypothetical protein